MTNDNRQTEMLESEIMFSLLKKFLEVEFFFFTETHKDKNCFYLIFNATLKTNISFFSKINRKRVCLFFLFFACIP